MGQEVDRSRKQQPKMLARKADGKADDMPASRRLATRHEKLVLTHPQTLRERRDKLRVAGAVRKFSWDETELYAVRELGFDFSALRRVFETDEGLPSIYDGTTPLAKVFAHLSREHCGLGRPQRRSCVQARALYGLYLAIERERLGPVWQRFVQMAHERKLRDEEDRRALVQISEDVRKMTFDEDGDPNMPAMKMIGGIHPFSVGLEASFEAASEVLKEASVVSAKRPRRHERAILVNVEAELLTSGLFKEEEVLELVRDVRRSSSSASSGPIDRIKKRRRSPAELVQIRVVPWQE